MEISHHHSIPLVSICCVTYNHENYIRQCLEGVVMQQTSFRYEILVHEDASTDNTAKIVKEYETKYPHLFRCIYQTENQFAIQNTLFNILIPMSVGKYIALCEGDDYWTDPFKLQKQVDFLEANPEYGLVYGKARIFQQKNSEFIGYKGSKEAERYEKLFIGPSPVPTPTVLFRADLCIQFFKEMHSVIINSLSGDFPMWLWFSRKSKVKFLDEVFSVYRVLSVSACHNEDPKVSLKFNLSAFKIKLYFLLKYPISDEYMQNLVYVEIIKQIEEMNNINYLIGGQDKTEVLPYKIGYNLLKPIKLIRNLLPKKTNKSQ